MSNITQLCSIENYEGCAAWAKCYVEDYFPCSNTVLGNIFLILVYGYILARGSKTLADGSELLMEILDPGFIGGFLLPVLGALPDTAIIFVSGINGNDEEVKDEILVGMGTLAGSTIMLLTIAWASSVLVGRCTISPQGRAIDRNLSPAVKWNPMKTGVTCDDDLMTNSRIMIGTTLSYFIIQGIAFKHVAADANDETSIREESPYVLASLIITALMFISYSVYMVFNTKMQQKRLAAAKKKYMLDRLAEMFHDNIINRDVAQELDDESDDGKSSLLRHEDSAVNLRDSMQVSKIDEDVLKVVGRWRKQVEETEAHRVNGADVEEAETEGEEEEEKIDLSKKQILLRSMAMMGLGTIVIVIFSKPMVDVITVFSGQVRIPPFYTSFVITPFVSNASEVIAAIVFAAKKRKKNISLTFGAIYGAVTMNNTMCLTVFLMMVYMRKLVWEFSAEVVSTVFVIMIMGALTCFRTTFRCWEAFVVFTFYPMSLGVVAGLRSLGWF